MKIKSTLTTFLTTFSLFASATALAAMKEPSPEETMANFCKSHPRPEYANLKKVSSNDDWFELYEVAPGVTAIYEVHQWQEVISYLIEGSTSAILFDSGNGISDIAAVVKSLTDKPVAVVNSHSHYDHVGGNYSFDKIYGMSTEFTLSRQAGVPNHEIADEVSDMALCRELPKGLTPDNHIGKPYKITHTIKNGSKIDLGNRTLEVIHVPGHTPDALVLIDREAGLMWTGDTFYPDDIWLYVPETNLDDYEKSLQKLVKEVPHLNTLLPAHVTTAVDPKVLLDVQKSFTDMLAGKLQGTDVGGGMVRYQPTGNKKFAFIMRDEPLPYSSKP